MKYIIGFILALSLALNLYFYNSYRTYIVIFEDEYGMQARFKFKSYTDPVVNYDKDTSAFQYVDWFVSGRNSIYFHHE